jgi:hypothetical protein
MQITSGGSIESHGVIRLLPFPDSVAIDTASDETRPVIAVDSFRLDLIVDAASQNEAGFELLVFRLPASVDSTTAYTDIQATFTDSTELASILVTDVSTEDTLAIPLHADAFPTLVDDSAVAALGISIRSTEPAFLNLETLNNSPGSIRIARFVQVDSADGQPAARTDITNAAFDTFVFSDIAPSAPTALDVGGTPSARAFLHVELPPRIIDSSSVIRATLLLVPEEPVVGAPGDSIRILAEGLAADIGPKSPVVQVPRDSIGIYSGLASVGSSDTLRIDVTHIIAPWKNDPDAARVLTLRAVREAGTLAEFRFGSSASTFAAPALHLTFVPQVVIGN